MTAKPVSPDTLPSPDAFRHWLRGALAALSLRPARYGPEIGLGKNTISHFLGKPDRDVGLGTASSIVADLQARAAAEGVTLKPLPRLSPKLQNPGAADG